MGEESVRTDCHLPALGIFRQTGKARALLVAEVRGARALSDRAFTDATRRVYECIADQARQLALPHPLRVWNAIPAIHDPSIDGDRYMSFNFGRYEAMRQWFGGELVSRVPAATGVGCSCDVLRVAALLSDVPGTPIENPKQIPAYQYSARFGRLPPCFARATRWKDLLFIAGTAAVVGEESQHPSEFDRQLSVTLDHLRQMLDHGLEGESTRRFTAFRVYLPEQPQRSARKELVSAALQTLAPVAVEWVNAELCRRDLLVEIEAVGTCSELFTG